MKTNVRLAHRRTKMPLALVAIAIIFACAWGAGPLFGADPYTTDVTARYAPPSREHLLGTDHLGRDVLARVLAAGVFDLGIGFSSAIVSFTFGTLLGAVSGYVGGRWDRFFMRVFDVWQSIPGILLGLLVLTLVGRGLGPLMAVVSIAYIPIYARMVRAEMLPERRSTLVQAAALSGVPGWRILLVYLLPRHLTAALAYLPVQAGFAIAMTAGFGFIGLGIKPPAPEWGAMISDGLSDLIFLNIWWTTLPAGVLLALTGLLLFQSGDWLLQRVGEPAGARRWSERSGWRGA